MARVTGPGTKGVRTAMVTAAEVRATAKARDAWWTVLLVDPLALRLVGWSAGRRWITPNRLTLAAFTVTIGAAAAFALGTRWWLVLGAAVYHAGFVLDCMDGKLARLRGSSSPLGQWLDFMLDRVGVTICAVALFGGQYRLTRDPLDLALGAVVIFLNLFHQLNGQIMEGALRQARDTAQPSATLTPTGRTTLFTRVRSGLGRHRIRADIFSAIEFQMAVFIVGPVLGLVAPVTATACVLLVLFELAAMVKFAHAARSAPH